MKKFLILASLVALAGCNEAEAPEAEAPAEAPAPAAEVALAPDGQPGPGTFEVTYADGSTGSVTTTAEGTYTGTQGDETVSGTVTNTDGKVCFDPDGDDTPAVCWTTSAAAADGSWTSTSDAGETVTVKRAAS